jgi:hypothetical protein
MNIPGIMELSKAWFTRQNTAHALRTKFQNLINTKNGDCNTLNKQYFPNLTMLFL